MLKIEETQSYKIITILGIKITLKKKHEKSYIDKIAWWIPNKNLRNLFRNTMRLLNNLEALDTKFIATIENSSKSIDKISKYVDQKYSLFDDDIKSIVKSQFKNSITHLSAYTVGNAGDNILVSALRDEIDKLSNNSFIYVSKNVRARMTDEVISIANQTKAIIVGGGGLFLKDTNANDISGWQFPVSINNIEKIKVPLFLMAIGYNRFRTQDDFLPYFRKNINKIAEKAEYIGLRNGGSIRALQNYVDKKYHDKLIYFPCATTLLSKIYYIPEYNIEEKFIAINCAFDREQMRYGDIQDSILSSISNVLKKLSEKYKIKFYKHMNTDEKILPYFDNVSLEYEIINLNLNIGTDKFLEYYSTPELVFAVRGHAQLIPFGCNVPTLSIISHDKLEWFLEDINHPEYGVDVMKEHFEERLLETANYMLNNREKIITEIKKEQERLLEITKENINIFNNIINSVNKC